MVMERIVLDPVDCTTADEFAEALSPLGPHFKDVGPSDQWLFRGQGEDKPLIPSAFRQEGKAKLAQLSGRPVDTYGALLLAERDVLSRFFEIADKRGLVLPDDSRALRDLLETLNSERGRMILEEGHSDRSETDAVLSIIALAQHYRIPTRLLDWSKRPWVAAYFAAEGAFRREKDRRPGDTLVVWAFFYPTMGKHDSIGKTSDPLRVITAPSATNTNLRAQQGAFTLLSPYYTGEAYGPYKPMDQVLDEIAARGNPEKYAADRTVQGSKLQKYTLPASEALELLRLLAKLDITPSSIYPGYESIIRDLEYLSHWR
jgi:hypothetical protein